MHAQLAARATVVRQAGPDGVRVAVVVGLGEAVEGGPLRSGASEESGSSRCGAEAEGRAGVLLRHGLLGEAGGGGRPPRCRVKRRRPS